MNLNHLTEGERDIILAVLKREEDIREQDFFKLSSLQAELHALRLRSVPRQGADSQKTCMRCQVELGFFFNRGQACPKCKHRVCTGCRVEAKLRNRHTEDTWLCVLCSKQQELDILEGNWLKKANNSNLSDIPSQSVPTEPDNPSLSEQLNSSSESCTQSLRDQIEGYKPSIIKKRVAKPEESSSEDNLPISTASSVSRISIPNQRNTRSPSRSHRTRPRGRVSCPPRHPTGRHLGRPGFDDSASIASSSSDLPERIPRIAGHAGRTRPLARIRPPSNRMLARVPATRASHNSLLSSSDSEKVCVRDQRVPATSRNYPRTPVNVSDRRYSTPPKYLAEGDLILTTGKQCSPVPRHLAGSPRNQPRSRVNSGDVANRRRPQLGSYTGSSQPNLTASDSYNARHHNAKEHIAVTDVKSRMNTTPKAKSPQQRRHNAIRGVPEHRLNTVTNPQYRRSMDCISRVNEIDHHRDIDHFSHQKLGPKSRLDVSDVEQQDIDEPDNRTCLTVDAEVHTDTGEVTGLSDESEPATAILPSPKIRIHPPDDYKQHINNNHRESSSENSERFTGRVPRSTAKIYLDERLPSEGSQSSRTKSEDDSDVPYDVEELTQVKFRRVSVRKIEENRNKRDQARLQYLYNSAVAEQRDCHSDDMYEMHSDQKQLNDVVEEVDEDGYATSLEALRRMHAAGSFDQTQTVSQHPSASEEDNQTGAGDVFLSAPSISRQSSNRTVDSDSTDGSHIDELFSQQRPIQPKPTLSASSDSLNSRISFDPEDSAYNKVQTKGDIEFSLHYQPRQETLFIDVSKCRGLAAVDTKRDRSNPYVKTYLLPDRKSKRKIPAKRNTLNPVFNKVIKYDISPSELKKRTLTVSVWHQDRLGHNVFLGEVVKKQLDPVLLVKPKMTSYHLSPKAAYIPDPVTIRPLLAVSIRYVSAERRPVRSSAHDPKLGELQLLVLSASGINGLTKSAAPITFVKGLFWSEDREYKSMCGAPVHGSFEPQYDTTLLYESDTYLHKHVLDIALYEKGFSNDAVIGFTRLQLATDGSRRSLESSIWQKVCQDWDTWHNAQVELRTDPEELARIRHCGNES